MLRSALGRLSLKIDGKDGLETGLIQEVFLDNEDEYNIFEDKSRYLEDIIPATVALPYI